MKKFCLFIFALIGSYSVMAQQFGVEVNGVYFASGSSLSIGCLSSSLDFAIVAPPYTVIGTYNAAGGPTFSYPNGWQLIEEMGLHIKHYCLI